MKKKILLGLSILVIVVIARVLYSTRIDHSGWGEITNELLEYQRKLETQGYLTEDDLNQIKRFNFNKLPILPKTNKPLYAACLFIFPTTWLHQPATSAIGMIFRVYSGIWSKLRYL